MRVLIFSIILLCSCGKKDTASSFSRLRNFKFNELTQAVSIRDGHGCAILYSGGALKCWGDNKYGQDTSEKAVQAVSVGMDHTCAILDDHTLKCWGNNRHGQIGDGSTAPPDGPTEISLGKKRSAKMISTGNSYTCAILDNDSLKCWGRNDRGQLGIGNNTTPKTSPVIVSLGSNKKAKMITTGEHHACAIIMDDHSIKCWGENQSGQIGDDSTDPRTSPVTVNLAKDRTAQTISAGGEHTCALLDDRSIVCWGLNDNGQLGDGTTTQRNTPTSVSMNSFHWPESLSLGHKHSCALLGNGTPLCWGANDHYQLGDGSTTPRSIPASPNLGIDTTARAIVAGSQHTCAIIADDSLICWGDNTSGRLGDGTEEDSPTPVTVKL